MSGKKHALRIGFVTAVVLALVQYFVPGGWGWVFTCLRQFAAASVAWAGASVSIPAWLLSLLSAITLTVICAAASVVYKRLQKREAGIESFTTAEIFGIRWRWTIREGDIRNIASFCPKCDRPVGPMMESRHGFIHLISYKCDCGKWRSQSFQCSQVDFIDQVYRTIQQEGAKKAC